MRDAVALDELPHPRGRRIVGRPVVEDDRRAEHEPAGDEPGAHHPADVGRPEDRVAVLEIEAVREILRRLHGKAAVHVERALRLPGRARGVDDHVRILGARIGELERRPLAVPQDLVPRRVPRLRRKLAADAPHDDDALHARRGVGGGVGGLLHRHDLPAAVEAVRTDEDPRLRVAQPARDGVRAVAGEHRDEDRPDRTDREHRDGALQREGQEHRHAIALRDAERAKARGGAGDLGPQLPERERADRALLALGDDRDAPGLMPQRGRHVVHAPAGPPGRPGDAARVVVDARVVLRPHDAEVALGGAPEAVEVGLRPPQERGVVAVPVALGERAHAAAREVRVGRLPRRHVAHGSASVRAPRPTCAAPDRRTSRSAARRCANSAIPAGRPRGTGGRRRRAPTRSASASRATRAR